MESNAGKRQSGGNLATTNGRPNNPPPTNNGGPINTPQVEETREATSQGMEVHESDGYATQSEKCLVTAGNPFPRNQTTFPSNQAAPKSSSKDHSHVLEPPVTKATLSELDVNKIINNPKLRHDINFDPELHFRPNLDGDKGRRKTQKAAAFWETMRNQLQEYLLNRENFEREIGDGDWALPSTLRAIRGILETLVPQRDRPSVEETFNVDLLMQQFRKGVADMVKLANWLSQLLKCHCAPMRDDWVDNMVMQLGDGDRNHDVALLAEGMQNLLAVLEAMKLDVANHQIRCLRPLLIEDTVHFEQKFFMKKIAMGRVDVINAHAWFRRASRIPEITAQNSSMNSQGNTWDFMKALINLTLPSKSSEKVPHTFLFDEERLIKLRSDMLDLINLEICMQLYRNLEASSRLQDLQEARLGFKYDTPTTSFVSSPCDRPESPADHNSLSSPTIPLPHHFVNSRTKQTQPQGLSPLTRVHATSQPFASTIEDDRIGSSASSCRSSPSSLASTPDMQLPTPLYLSRPSEDSASQVRASLLAILSSCTSSDKWAALSSSLALQILRSTTTPLTRLPQFESQLAFYLSNDDSTYYQEAERRVLSQVFPALHGLVETYTSLSSLQIFEAATSPKGLSASNASHLNTGKEEIKDFATRVAHIGILHWRVWAPLAYLVDPDAEEECEPPVERARSMP